MKIGRGASPGAAAGVATPSPVGLTSRMRSIAERHDLRLPLVLSVLTFGLAYLGYQYFYSQLGLKLDQLGLDFQHILVRSWGLFLLATTLSALMLFAISALWQMIPELRLGGRLAGDPSFYIGLLLITLMPWLLLSTIKSTLDERIDSIRRGMVTQSITFDSIPLLDISASSVCMSTVQPSTGTLQSSRSLLLLGGDGNTFVLYNASKAEIMFVPVDAVVLREPIQNKNTPGGAC